jgi:long-chain fatty acid transport protein
MKTKILKWAVTAALAAPAVAMATTGYFAHGYGLKAKGMGGVGIALPQEATGWISSSSGSGRSVMRL